MIKKEKIVGLVEQKIEGTDIFIVGISVGGDNKIFVRLDKISGISMEECQSISKFIESNLDREVEDFDLEVSSPGVGENLKVLQQYQKCIGRNVSVTTKEGIKRNGILLNIHDNEIEVEAEEKVKSEKSKKKILQKSTYKFNIDTVTVKEVISLK